MEEQDIQTNIQEMTSTESVVVVPKHETKESSVTPNAHATWKEKILAWFGVFFVTGMVVGIMFLQWHNRPVEPEYVAAAPLIKESIPQPPKTANPFTEVSLQAKAAIVYDIKAGKMLYGLHEDTQLPLASLTKLMTGLLATESTKAGAEIAIASSSLLVEGDSGLLANERWNVKDLVSFMMVTSSNDGADALAASVGSLWISTPKAVDENGVEVFVDTMNSRALELGLEKTNFTNPTGLDGSHAGGLGTAEDVATLLTYIWKNEPGVLTHTTEQGKTFISSDGFRHVTENTNEIVYEIPGLIGGKTGYTDQAGGNLGVIYDAGLDHPIVIVVLGSTRQGRFSDVKKLIDATYAYGSSGWGEYENAGTTPPVDKTVL